jgi:hypothetical protein
MWILLSLVVQKYCINGTSEVKPRKTVVFDLRACQQLTTVNSDLQAIRVLLKNACKGYPHWCNFFGGE